MNRISRPLFSSPSTSAIFATSSLSSYCSSRSFSTSFFQTGLAALFFFQRASGRLGGFARFSTEKIATNIQSWRDSKGNIENTGGIPTSYSDQPMTSSFGSIPECLPYSLQISGRKSADCSEQFGDPEWHLQSSGCRPSSWGRWPSSRGWPHPSASPGCSAGRGSCARG